VKKLIIASSLVLTLPTLGGAAALDARATPNSRVFVGRQGDTFRVPAAATRCFVSAEAGSTNVICNHVGKHRYEVVLYKDNLLVFRVGRPDRPVFSARGKP
jgi:hypothetical protein